MSVKLTQFSKRISRYSGDYSNIHYMPQAGARRQSARLLFLHLLVIRYIGNTKKWLPPAIKCLQLGRRITGVLVRYFSTWVKYKTRS